MPAIRWRFCLAELAADIDCTGRQASRNSIAVDNVNDFRAIYIGGGAR